MHKSKRREGGHWILYEKPAPVGERQEIKQAVGANIAGPGVTMAASLTFSTRFMFLHLLAYCLISISQVS